jgi:diaminopimelate epimerase
VIAKYSGCGNTFIIVHDGGYDRAKTLCEKFDCDGLLVLTKSDRWCVDIVNRDGTFAALCGNGLRSAAHHLYRLGHIRQQDHIETGSGVLEVFVDGDEVEAEMPKPQRIEWDIALDILGHSVTGHFIKVGVPHFILDGCDLSFEIVAPHIRRHPYFGVDGTNVNQMIGDQVLTFERGVEGITGSCGSGITASYLALARGEVDPKPKTLFGASGEPLTVQFRGDRLTIRGLVTLLFEREASCAIISD